MIIIWGDCTNVMLYHMRTYASNNLHWIIFLIQLKVFFNLFVITNWKLCHVLILDKSLYIMSNSNRLVLCIWYIKYKSLQIRDFKLNSTFKKSIYSNSYILPTQRNTNEHVVFTNQSTDCPITNHWIHMACLSKLRVRRYL